MSEQPTYRPTEPRDVQRFQDWQEPAPESAPWGRPPPEPEPQASAAEREAKGELIQGELAGKTIYTPPVKQWRASALHALREGDLMGWAEATLSDDDWAIWEDVDPTVEQIEDFFATINKQAGTNPGNSRASRRSSRSTRRR